MCEIKIKNIFQEKLEIHKDIIIERSNRTKGKRVQIIQQDREKTAKNNRNKTCQL